MDNSSKIAGRWNYVSHTTPFQFGELDSYHLSVAWLNSCDDVEDWGCGCAFAKQFFTTKYTGIDGSYTPWGDKIVDLTKYQSSPHGLLMRHVLEHNPEWRVILKNAVMSFRKRMMLVMFIPPTIEDVIITPEICVDYVGGATVSDIGCCESDLLSIINPFLKKIEKITKTNETAYYLEK